MPWALLSSSCCFSAAVQFGLVVVQGVQGGAGGAGYPGGVGTGLGVANRNQGSYCPLAHVFPRLIAIKTVVSIYSLLLPCRAHIPRQRLRVAGAKGVDVQTAATGVAGIDGQFVRLAALGDVHEHPLHAVFMKTVVLAKADDVAQQPGLVDLRIKVADLHGAPVGLAGHGAVAA